MVRWARSLVVAAALAGMIALAGLVLGRIYADSLLVVFVGGAGLGSVGLSVAVRRLPNWAVAPISAVLLTAYTIGVLKWAAGRAEMTGPLVQIARDSLGNGIPRLLTAMIPVEPTPDTVVVPVIAAWLAGLAATEVAVRAGRVLLGLVPVTALYAGALYVVGPNASTAGGTTLGFAGLAIVALTTSNRPARAEGPTKVRGSAAAAGLVAVLAFAAAIGPWIGGQVSATPVDPRRYVQPPQVDSLDESPLNRISGWMLAPEQRLLEVSPVPGRKRIRLRLAVMPDYDGITWRVGATYRNAGRVLPQQPRLADATVDTVRQQITIDGLTGRLLPAVPTPAEITGARVAFDAATGTVIAPAQLAAGLRYDVVSAEQTPDLDLLPAADVPSGGAVARYLTVGDNVPEPIQRLAEQLAEGNGAAYDRAAAIEEFLSEHYRKVADAPSGHAYPNLSFFLFGPRDQGGQVGTSEQFAASFAVLARLTGLPSRVVVGFDAPAAGGAVTGGDAIAWPEVLFDGLGWVPFDPMPKNKNPRPVEEDFTPKPTKPPSPPSEPPPSVAPSSSSAPPAALAADPGNGPGAVVVAGGASGSVLLVLVAAALVLLAMRRSLRNRRLFEGTPDARIAGAWAELRDALRLAGRPMPSHLAATEAAAYAATPAPPKPGRLRRATPEPAPISGPAPASGPAPTSGPAPISGPAPMSGPVSTPDPALASGRAPTAERAPSVADPPLPPLDELVAGINTVGFAPGAADDGQAARAGRQAVEYATALRARRSWWRRIWWSLHPGPLRWHRD
ncbi:MAG TPA: transglutaminaseTgpA domain-containing protein [Actinoplanes sp.]|jgi:transglutaminase-like putative cysteine protease|nr:transglutaminaseTgpA domain-containing protein [Actinoplanes sp.]